MVGTLVLEMFLGGEPTYLAPDVPALFQPIGEERIMISSRDFVASPLVGMTTSAGVYEARLPPGRYQVEITDDRFHISTIVPVFTGEETRISVRVHTVTHNVNFEELRNVDSRGWITNSTILYVSTESAEQIARPGDTVFLRAAAFPLAPQESSPTQPVPAVVLQENLGEGVLWIQLRPSHPVRIASLANTAIVTYEYTYKVRIFGGEPNAYNK